MRYVIQTPTVAAYKQALIVLYGLGVSLEASRYTVEQVLQRFPHYPNILLNLSSTGNMWAGPLSNTNVFNTLISLGQAVDYILEEIKQRDKKPLVFPPDGKYRLKYTKEGGEVAEYTVSNPIESNNDSLTVYAFAKGVRTFKKSRVLEFEKINCD